MIRPTEIALMVEDAFDLKPGCIAGRLGTNRATAARHVYIWLLCHGLQYGVLQAARSIGRDHASSLNSLERVEQLIGRDPDYADRVNGLLAEVTWRAALDGCRDVDVLAIADKIRNSRRAAMGATVNEITALSIVLIDVWSAALVAEAVLGTITFTEGGEIAPLNAETTAAIRACRAAFLNQMDTFRTTGDDDDVSN